MANTEKANAGHPAPPGGLEEFISLHGTRPGHSSQLTREYYDSLLIQMNYLDSGEASTKVKLFGEEFSSPLCISALSHLKDFGSSSSGMEELGKAAKVNDIIDFCGTGDMDEFKRILDTGAKVIRIIKPFEQTDVVYDTIRFAKENGAFAVGMDIDHSIDFEGRIGSCEGKKLLALTTKQLKEFVNASHEAKLPFVVKGVLSAQDTQKCMQAGADAIFVSHHHGMFNYMTPPPMMLPEIAQVVRGRIPIIIDGNIESAYDAFKALALGATMTAVGRPLLPLVIKGGAEAVGEWFSKQQALLSGIMARSCCATVSDIDLSHIRKKEHLF